MKAQDGGNDLLTPPGGNGTLPPKRPSARGPAEAAPAIETASFAAGMGRMMRAYGRRLATGDVDDLTTALSLSADLDAMIAAAVLRLRAEQGYTWAEIGAAAGGLSKQGAQQRWGR